MVTLKADNRSLINNSKFAYITQNYSKNVSSLEVSNTEPFIVTTPIFFGDVGKTNAEILKVRSISDDVITLGDVNNIATSTKYDHPESTKIYALQYDQIRFFWTAALGTIADEDPIFSDANPLTAWTTLDPTSFYTTYSDSSHSTGFGWFQYRNAITGETSQESNPIPYTGFASNTVRQVFADFNSSMNTNELRLISNSDKFTWLNEALADVKNKLNLSNVEYTVSTPKTLTTIAGTAEYPLEDDFSDLVEITDGVNGPISFISVADVMENNESLPTVTKYYLRGRYIGFSPTPTASGDLYYYTYRAKSTRVVSLSTYIDLPDNAFYALTDFMLYRAAMKFKDPLASVYYQSFKNSVDLYIQSGHKRDANLDSIGISSSSNA